MFKKTDRPDELPEAPPAPGYTADIQVRTRSVSVIGPTLVFKGELSANEDLVIEGQVEGRISHQEKHLTVGKQGRVAADIRALSVEIQGAVTGDIYGEEIVRLTSSAVVSGNIDCGRVVIEDGATFSGSIKMDRRTDSKSKARLQVAEGAGPVTDVEQGAA